MLAFIKNIFGPKTPKSGGCCGKPEGCCGKPPRRVDIGLDEADLKILAGVDDKIMIGKITDIQPHSDPKVTKVKVTQCDLGNGKIEQILCGGSNIEVGMIVPVATVGADLGGGFIIGERAIRGEMSHGMICAQAELGLSAKSEEKGEIWPLPAILEPVLGASINQL